MHSLYHKILYTNNVSREQLFMSVPDLRYSTQQIDVLGESNAENHALGIRYSSG